MQSKRNPNELTVYYYDTPISLRTPLNACGHTAASTNTASGSINYLSFAGMKERDAAQARLELGGLAPTVEKRGCEIYHDKKVYCVEPLEIKMTANSESLKQAEEIFKNRNREDYALFKNNCAHTILQLILDAGLVTTCDFFYSRLSASLKGKYKEENEQKLALLHKKSHDLTRKWALRPKEVAKFCCIISLMQIEIKRETIRLEQISNDLKLKNFLANDIYALEMLATFAQIKRKKTAVTLLNGYIAALKTHLAKLDNSSHPQTYIKDAVIPIYTTMLNQLKENMKSKSMRLLLGVQTSASNQQLKDYLNCIDKSPSLIAHPSSPIFARHSVRTALSSKENKVMEQLGLRHS